MEAGGYQQKLPCHAEMYDEYSFIEPDQNVLAAARDGLNLAASQFSGEGRSIARRHVAGREFRRDDPASRQIRRERAHHGFDFRQFGHS